MLGAVQKHVAMDHLVAESDYEAANGLNTFFTRRVCSQMSPCLTSQVYLTDLIEKN